MMASLKGCSVESEDQLRSYNRSGSGDKPLRHISKNTSLNNTPSQAVTRQRPPPKWKLVGLAQDKLPTDSRGNYSAQIDRHDSDCPPDVPPRMGRRRMSDDPEIRREKPPALPPRNASDSQARGLSAGFVKARKGGFSGTLGKWSEEREKVSHTGRVACVPPTLQEKWDSGLETLSLLQFVEKYSTSLPALIGVEKGHYGSNDPETLGSQEKLIVSFVKSRVVLNIVTSTKQKFTLPIGSAIQLCLLYNPEGDIERARKGYKFQSVGEMIRKFPEVLPWVIRATKAYSGDSLQSSVHENEQLIVESYDKQANKLRVISHGKNPVHKFLPHQCTGQFTTEPSKVCLYVSDINNYIRTSLSTLEPQAVVNTSELAMLSADVQYDKSLDGVVTLAGFVTEQSLISTRVEEEGLGAPSTEPKAFEIPVNDNLCHVEVTVIKTNMAIKHFPSITVDAQLELLCQEEISFTSTIQRLFDNFLRHGHERDGVTISGAYNVYDEVHEPPPSMIIQEASPYSVTHLLTQVQVERSPHNDDPNEADSGMNTDLEVPDDSSSLNKSTHNDSVDHHVTKSELEMTIRSVLSEVMDEKQKIQYERNPGGYNHTSMDSRDDGVDVAGKVKLNDIIMELSEIENLWYMFGIHLGMQKAKLDQIQANYGSGPWPQGRCLIETIYQWQENYENATWSSIVRALYSMQKKLLAKRVAAKHRVMLPDPRKFTQDQFTKSLKEFIPEDKISEINSRQQHMQEQDQRLSEVQERLGEYEQRMEENHKNLMAIKGHLLFNERCTRMLTTENQVLRMKLAYKEQLSKLFKNPVHDGKRESAQNSQESLRKEIRTLHEEQERHERRLDVTYHDTMELKRQLLLLENQLDGTKKHLHRLQDQKHELTKGLREQECELSHVITGSLGADIQQEEELPQYYNIIRCNGKVEVKLHKEELAMLQKDLETKKKEVGCLKTELRQKHEHMSQVESWLANQDGELMNTNNEGAESVILEKHNNDHLKTRLQLEKIDCQFQLTKALLQKKEIELKLEAVEQSLVLNETICKRVQEQYQKSTDGSSTNGLVPPTSRMQNRSTSFSSTTSEDSDVFSASITHSPPTALANNKLSHNRSEFNMHHQLQSTEYLQMKPFSVKSPTTNYNTESVIEEQECATSAASYANIEKGKPQGSRQRSGSLQTGPRRNYHNRASSASSGGARHGRNPAKHSQTYRSCHKTQAARNY